VLYIIYSIKMTKSFSSYYTNSLSSRFPYNVCCKYHLNIDSQQTGCPKR